jgi:hypothetical protein
VAGLKNGRYLLFMGLANASRVVLSRGCHPRFTLVFSCMCVDRAGLLVQERRQLST